MGALALAEAGLACEGEDVPELAPEGIETFSSLGGRGGGGRFAPVTVGTREAEGDRGKFGLVRTGYGGGAGPAEMGDEDATLAVEPVGDMPPNVLS